ncbi:DUF6164 family protein [Gilvimarinus sp. SDUM040013]|nr:DUF6164 family protein [Gilvimarinus sp. SDUM040013]
MKTSGASAEEVDGLVAALEGEDIACYVTDSGRWKIGVDGLWLVNEAERERAIAVCEEFERSFAQQSMEQHRAMRERGEALNFLGHAMAHPIKTIAGIAAIVFILGLSLLPFIRGL